MGKRKSTQVAPQTAGVAEENVSKLGTDGADERLPQLGATEPGAQEDLPPQNPASGSNGQEEQPKSAVVSAAAGLNLRQGPAVLFPVLAVLQSGDEVERLSLPPGLEVPGWMPVKAQESMGWVDARFLAWQEE